MRSPQLSLRGANETPFFEALRYAQLLSGEQRKLAWTLPGEIHASQRANLHDSTHSSRHLQVSGIKPATMSSGSTAFTKFFEQFRRPQNQRSFSQPELPEAVALHSNADKPSLERRKTIDGGIQPLRGEDRKEDRYLSGVLAAGSGI